MLCTSTFVIGATVRCAATFAVSSNNAPYDPTGVLFELRHPDDSVIAYVYGTDTQLVRDSIGNYHVDILTTDSGEYFFRFAGTGTGATAQESVFKVAFSNVLQT